MSIQVTELWRYPVKSCKGEKLAEAYVENTGLAGDRLGMIVDAEGRFQTQRTLPSLAAIYPQYRGGTLYLRAPGIQDVTFKIRQTVNESWPMRVHIWKSRGVQAIDQDDVVAEWLSRYLDRPVRLVWRGEGYDRPVQPGYGQPGDQVSFADGYPIQLVNLASLELLNSWLPQQIPLTRFRANIVVAGAAPFAEDEWLRIRIGEVEFDLVRPCSRCEMPSIDQMTCSVMGEEPLQTLSQRRHGKDHRGKPGNFFGQLGIPRLVPGGDNIIKVGDEVSVLTTKDRPVFEPFVRRRTIAYSTGN